MIITDKWVAPFAGAWIETNKQTRCRKMIDYYEPKADTFVLENMTGDPFELVGVWEAAPGERKTFPKGSLKLYVDHPDDLHGQPFIHIGCTAFALEIDGKRYEMRGHLSMVFKLPETRP